MIVKDESEKVRELTLDNDITFTILDEETAFQLLPYSHMFAIKYAENDFRQIKTESDLQVCFHLNILVGIRKEGVQPRIHLERLEDMEYFQWRETHFDSWYDNTNGSKCHTRVQDVNLFTAQLDHDISLDAAKMFLINCIALIGWGFHPDNYMKDYIVMKDNKPLFQKMEATELELFMESVRSVFKENRVCIYEYCTEILEYRYPFFNND